ncbi:hypothetical protein EZZ80_23930 [Pseudomonas putida]|nr:hypothetical protein DM483_01725 [Pseudomonas sp. SMT-1]QDW56302.1 hypothetical protein FFH79_005185 [Pseudomonas sp. KBS0802]UZA76369.1 hypothetical protein EZZ80_23930 [Pseudomonas putida]
MSPPVGAGSPANGPGLLANFHRPFAAAAAIVFAGKPAPTRQLNASSSAWFISGVPMVIRRNWAIRGCLK